MTAMMLPVFTHPSFATTSAIANLAGTKRGVRTPEQASP